MKGLRTPLAVKRIPKKHWWNRQYYILIKPLEYAAKCGVIITVPAGFVTDFATWIKPRGRYDLPSVVHDFLYSLLAGRKFADHVFKEMMMRAGCTRLRINVMYYGVRLFGWIPYYYKLIKSHIIKTK